MLLAIGIASRRSAASTRAMAASNGPHSSTHNAGHSRPHVVMQIGCALAGLQGVSRQRPRSHHRHRRHHSLHGRRPHRRSTTEKSKHTCFCLRDDCFHEAYAIYLRIPMIHIYIYMWMYTGICFSHMSTNHVLCVGAPHDHRPSATPCNKRMRCR